VILCRKFQQAGFDVWCDPEIAFSHSGKFEWRGVLSKAIAQGPGQSRISPHLIQDLRNETDPHKLGELVHEAYKEWGNNWSAPPAELLTLATLARRSTCILETGSGLSTIVMAVANPNANIHCLEHDGAWCETLRQEIQRHGLTNVTIHLTPLSPENYFYQVPGDLPDWFDMVFHDGPVWLDGTNMAKPTDTRIPFYTLLANRVRDAILVIDDIEQYPECPLPYRHEIVGGRFAICLPNKRESAAA
jgi:predicted O-methyltransferase YrrM